MISLLLAQVVAELRTGFTGVFSNTTTLIETGPVSVPAAGSRPHLVVNGLELTLNQAVNDDVSSQPRNLELRQSIPVNVATPAGPYALAQRPLDGTLEVTVVYQPGTVGEYSKPLLPGTDFTVNSAAQNFTVLASLAGASTLLVVYSYVGLATLREFGQLFSVEYYAANRTMVYQHMGLVSTILQTRHDALLDTFNFSAPSSFTANGYTTTVKLRRINPLKLEQVTTTAISDVRMRWLFETTGVIRMSRSAPGTFGIISSVHTRGQSGPGVKIAPNLG